MRERVRDAAGAFGRFDVAATRAGDDPMAIPAGESTAFPARYARKLLDSQVMPVELPAYGLCSAD